MRAKKEETESVSSIRKWASLMSACIPKDETYSMLCCHCIAIWPINILRFHSFNGSFDFSGKKVHLWLSSAKEKTHPVCTSIFYVKASLRLSAGQYTHCVKGAYLCECLHTQKKMSPLMCVRRQAFRKMAAAAVCSCLLNLRIL